MSTAAWGALLGGAAGAGMFMVAAQLLNRRHARFAERVLRPLGDLPQLQQPVATSGPRGPFLEVFGPVLQSTAGTLERVVGGAESVRRRIERAGLDMTVHQFRVEQATWGLAAFAVGSAVAILTAFRAPDRFLPLLVLATVSGVLGVLLRENRLTAQVRAHESRVLDELPAVAELLALAVAAGEGPVAALERVVHRSRGSLSSDLERVLGEVRTGVPVAAAFDAFAGRSGVPVIARFASGIAVAVERGTPLADVLHAQAGDVREARRRSLMESGARREVAMMMPVVFLVLPITILFAFWPGLIGLRMAT